jgi:hypothetical protein
VIHLGPQAYSTDLRERVVASVLASVPSDASPQLCQRFTLTARPKRLLTPVHTHKPGTSS